MKKAKIAILLGLIAAIGSGASWYFIPQKKAANMVVYCEKMEYACGDCDGGQCWRVNAVTGDNEDKLQHLVSTDIIVNYSESFARQLVEDRHKCINCYRFTFTGDLYYSAYRGYVLDSKLSAYTIREGCCK